MKLFYEISNYSKSFLFYKFFCQIKLIFYFFWNHVRVSYYLLRRPSGWKHARNGFFLPIFFFAKIRGAGKKMGLNDSFLIVFYENYKKLPILLVETRVFTRRTSDYFRKNGPKKTPQNFNEIGKKSKNGVHFIITVLKVKVLLFLLFFAYFMTFLTCFQKTLWKKN